MDYTRYQTRTRISLQQPRANGDPIVRSKINNKLQMKEAPYSRLFCDGKYGFSTKSVRGRVLTFLFAELRRILSWSCTGPKMNFQSYSKRYRFTSRARDFRSSEFILILLLRKSAATCRNWGLQNYPAQLPTSDTFAAASRCVQTCTPWYSTNPLVQIPLNHC